MPALTKQDLARNLLFWLLPWPLSRMLPKSLQIAYFGPSLPPLIPGNPPPWMPGYDPLNPWDPMFPGQPGRPTPGGGYDWTRYFDNTYWEKQTLIDWDGSKWTYTGNAGTLRLRVKTGSTWANSYRPIIISLSYTCTDTTVRTMWLIRDSPGNQMGKGQVVTDGQEQIQDINLDFSGCGDLYRIIFIMELQAPQYTLNITDIEMFGIPLE